MKTIFSILIMLHLFATTQVERFAPTPDKPKKEEVAQWKPIVMKPNTDTLPRRFNNDSVPSGHILKSQFNQVVMLRFKYQTDLLDGIQKAIAQEGIQNAVILSGVGSVTRHQTHTVSNSIFPSKNKYYEKEEPADIASINGFVIDGRLHAHMTLTTDKGAMGGHLEPNSRVFTFVALALGVLDQPTKLSHIDNKNWR